MIFQKSLQYLIIFEDIFKRKYLRKIIEDVESSDVKFMHSEDGRVTAEDKRKHSEAGNPVSHSDGKLSVKVLSTSQCVVLLVRGDAGVHDGGRGQPDGGLGCCHINGLLVVI